MPGESILKKIAGGTFGALLLLALVACSSSEPANTPSDSPPTPSTQVKPATENKQQDKAPVSATETKQKRETAIAPILEAPQSAYDAAQTKYRGIVESAGLKLCNHNGAEMSVDTNAEKLPYVWTVFVEVYSSPDTASARQAAAAATKALLRKGTGVGIVYATVCRENPGSPAADEMLYKCMTERGEKTQVTPLEPRANGN